MCSELIERQRNNFLYNVAWLRRQHRLSKKKMAQLLGISIGSLNKIENGELPPRASLEVLNKIHNTFGIALTDLFGKRLGE